jgi:putative NADH-flavin reductase
VTSMKPIVFDATGGVDQSVVKHTVKNGFEVTAFVRTPAKLEVTRGACNPGH